jgi:hypothetical protein
MIKNRPVQNTILALSLGPFPIFNIVLNATIKSWEIWACMETRIVTKINSRSKSPSFLLLHSKQS